LQENKIDEFDRIQSRQASLNWYGKKLNWALSAGGRKTDVGPGKGGAVSDKEPGRRKTPRQQSKEEMSTAS
jgi:hypothetical protein